MFIKNLLTTCSFINLLTTLIRLYTRNHCSIPSTIIELEHYFMTVRENFENLKPKKERNKSRMRSIIAHGLGPWSSQVFSIILVFIPPWKLDSSSPALPYLPVMLKTKNLKIPLCCSLWSHLLTLPGFRLRVQTVWSYVSLNSH